MAGDLQDVGNDRTILVTGAGGMLGLAFVETLATCSPTARVVALDKSALDVTQRDAVLALEKVRPDWIIHCAADVHADRCEENPDACAAVQVLGTRHVAELARFVGAQLLYPQSFLIFDGSELPITENTAPAPLSTYGKCKWKAEQVAREILPNTLIARMGGFFGGDDKDKNFVGKFAHHVARLLASGVDRIEVGDRVWQPTATGDLARNCLRLLALKKQGVYNMASHGEASFFDIACLCVSQWKVDHRLQVLKVPAAAMAQRDKAPRPAKAVMINQRLQAEQLDWQRPWRAALVEYVNRPYFQTLLAPWQHHRQCSYTNQGEDLHAA